MKEIHSMHMHTDVLSFIYIGAHGKEKGTYPRILALRDCALVTFGIVNASTLFIDFSEQLKHSAVSPPRCTNGYRRIKCWGVTPRWTGIPSRGE